MNGKEYTVISETLIKGLFKERARESHKGDYGKLVIVGGCKYYAGAPLLTEYGAAAVIDGMEKANREIAKYGTEGKNANCGTCELKKETTNGEINEYGAYVKNANRKIGEPENGKRDAFGSCFLRERTGANDENSGSESETADALASDFLADKIAANGVAALRTGAGLNALAVPDFLAAAIYGRVTASTVFPLSSSGGFIDFRAEEFDGAFRRATAACIGMGIGMYEGLGRVVEYSLGIGIPTVYDADALNYIAENLDEFKGANKRGKAVVTPHYGEMSRLAKTDIQRIAENPVLYAKNFAAEYGVVVLLKGADSMATDGREVLINKTGSPCMAKGGSGDLLSGIIGGLLAQGNPPIISAAAGAFLAGRAAEKAEKIFTQYGVLPTDTAALIPRVITEITVK
ncbi:MAG: NAD(P)H-hydrate dehydratase [Clostridiales bacterium]|nr:NAD(P)H-hydrate dehydratase [Clostridiales bacterium]